MTIVSWIAWGASELKNAGIQCHDPRLHMHQILSHITGKPMAALYRDLDSTLVLTKEQEQRLRDLVRRRKEGEPFQYLVGHESFWNSSFVVGKGVLIPRPETEQVVEWSLRLLPSTPLKIAELGPGSGNIGISLLQDRPRWEWFAFELNPESLVYTKQNLARLLPDTQQYHLFSGDFFEQAGLQAPFDAIIANPPYVTEAEMNELPLEVREEPELALVGGKDGLEVLRRLARAGSEWLKAEGWVISEVGASHEVSSQEIFNKQGYQKVACYRDYAGRPRVVVAQWPGREHGRVHH